MEEFLVALPYQPSKNLVEELTRRDVLPRWATRDQDWLTSLHKNVTEKEWPEEFRSTGAGLLDSSLSLATLISDKAILMPVSTPGYLRSLLDLMTYPMVPPNSSDPEATMFLHGQLMDEAANKLAFVLGMLAETGYLDSPDADNAFGGAVTTAIRFLYYHELGHLSYNSSNKEVPDWMIPGEEEIVEELIADQFGLGMLTLELRNHPELQPVGLVGVVLAIGFVALKEFAEKEYDGGVRRIKYSTFRMSRLFYWAELSVQLGGLTDEAIQNGKIFWEIIRGLLARVKEIPSPIFSLLMETIERPRTDWRVASNYLLQWCTFGDRRKVLSTVRQIRDSALQQADAEPRARRVLDVINFILEDTSEVEPSLGLREALDS